VHEDGTILLLNESRDTTVVDHGSHPEAWDAIRAVLDILDIASLHFQVLVVFIIKFLSASGIGSKSFLLGSLGSRQELLTLLVNFTI
jgi:hypothetical protein